MAIITIETVKGDCKNGAWQAGKAEPVEFEEAITASGFGRFNVCLLLCSSLAFFTSISVTSALSYVLSGAECDLSMDITNMGTLNIATYIGMMSSALMWGFLADTLGRKKIMVWGFLILGVNEALASQSQSYWVLMMLKFLSGFIFNGPFAVILPYISELHPTNLRAKLLLYTGVYYGIGSMLLPVLAWVVIPQDWAVSMFGGLYELHSWHIFLLICALPPLFTGITMALFPESPKFLMSRGRNEEALEVFKKIYAMNTGNHPDTYPVKQLVDELDGKNMAPTGLAALKGGFDQIRLLCRRPYLCWLLLVCFINSSAMLGNNTLRLWFPQIAAMVEDYDSRHPVTAPLCHILDAQVSNRTGGAIDGVVKCTTVVTGSTTYVNSVIIGFGTLAVYVIGGALINRIGKRELSALGLALSGAMALAVIWSNSLVEVVTLFTLFVAVAGMTGTALSAIIVDLFPTSVRAISVATFFMMGRTGTVIGGLLFPFLLSMGCMAPFLFVATIMFVGGVLCFIVPKTTNKRMK